MGDDPRLWQAVELTTATYDQVARNYAERNEQLRPAWAERIDEFVELLRENEAPPGTPLLHVIAIAVCRAESARASYLRWIARCPQGGLRGRTRARRTAWRTTVLAKRPPERVQSQRYRPVEATRRAREHG